MIFVLSYNTISLAVLGSLGYAKEDAEERVHYDQLQAMKRYHRRYGKVRNTFAS